MFSRLGPAIVSVAGFGAVVAYAVIIALADDRADAAESWSAMCAFGLVIAALGILTWLVIERRDGRPRFTTLPLPSAWLSAGVFAIVVGAGILLTAIEYAIWLAPLMAFIATLTIGLIFVRVINRRAERRRVSIRGSVRHLVWGMTIGPLGASILQLGAALAIIGAIMAGLYFHDPDIANSDKIRSIFDDLGTASADNFPDVYKTSTVALAIFTMLAIVAPLTEEILKPLGTLIADRGQPGYSQHDAFIAGASAGLGFGIVEALGYSLLQLENWPTMMLLRAPVISIHVAGSALVAIGWQKHRRATGGFPFVKYLGAALALHAAWNGLFASMLLTVVHLDDPASPDAASTVLISLIALALGVLLLSTIAWIVMYPSRWQQQHQRRSDPRPAPTVPIIGQTFSIDYEST